MDDRFNWCHNPNCHTRLTKDRVKGSGNDLVSRTRKMRNKRYTNETPNSKWQHFFCTTSCREEYIEKNIIPIVAINPIVEPKEIPVEEYTTQYGYKDFRIKRVAND